MKIVFIFDRVMHYHVGMFLELDKQIRAAGHELLLLSGRTANPDRGRVGLSEPILKNEKHYRFHELLIKSYTIRWWDGVIRLLERERPERIVFMSHVGNISSWRAQALAKKLGALAISWHCGYEYNDSFFKRWLMTRYLNRFDRHLAYHTNAAKYAKNFKVESSSIYNVYNTLDETKIDIIDKFQAKEQLVADLPQTKDKKILLYVGAVLEEKRLELVIAALEHLQRDDVIFVVVGDGGHLDVLKAHYGDRQDVVFLGRIVEGVGRYFDAADIFVLPGTGGLAINEAMAHKLPVISAYADGSADDLVDHGANGLRLYKETPQELADSLQELLDNENKRAAMGAKGFEMITGELSFANFIKRVITGLL